jgi:RNA polymerase sigma-70 factor (ECF subfamily)
VSDTRVLASAADLAIVERLRSGDEAAFMMLVEQHHTTMLRIARMYVSTRAVAEDVVQDAWLAVVKGLDRFEGRSSLRTWMYRIVANTAKTRGRSEGRSVPFSALAGDEAADLDAAMFQDADGRAPGTWRTPPASWSAVPEERLLGDETLRRIGRAIASLPPMQAQVIRLRDVLGWEAGEVCEVLDLTEANQRVLLHRARSRVRRDLDEYLSAGEEGA